MIILLMLNIAFANFDSQIEKYSEMYRVDKRVIENIIKVESNSQPYVFNDGCIGLMQIKYDTAVMMDYKGTVKDLYKPENNIRYATKYLRFLMITFEGDMNKVIAAYNRGHNSIDKYPNKDWSKDKYVRRVLYE